MGKYHLDYQLGKGNPDRALYHHYGRSYEKRRVSLVAGPDVLTRKLLRLKLSRVCGSFPSLDTGEGNEALRELRGGFGKKVALLLVDAGLEDLNGIEVARALRANGDFDKMVPILLTTEDRDSLNPDTPQGAEVMNLIGNGVVDNVVHKSAPAEVLRQAVCDAIRMIYTREELQKRSEELEEDSSVVAAA